MNPNPPGHVEGRRDRDQAVPFQRSMSGRPGRLPLLLNPSVPAAQASRLPTTTRPFSALFAASLGPCTMVHVWLAAGPSAKAVRAPRPPMAIELTAASKQAMTVRFRRRCLTGEAAIEAPDYGTELT
jgi:hypothetical protein